MRSERNTAVVLFLYLESHLYKAEYPRVVDGVSVAGSRNGVHVVRASILFISSNMNAWNQLDGNIHFSSVVDVIDLMKHKDIRHDLLVGTCAKFTIIDQLPSLANVPYNSTPYL
jgi:hypothetical protein